MVASECMENCYYNGLKKPITSGADAYCIKSQLGSGFFSKVYTAVRNNDGQTVAIKRFSRDTKHLEDDGRKVSKEIAALQRLLGVPGIVRYYDHYFVNGYTYLVMERPDNSVQLEKFINAYGSLPENLVKIIFKQLVVAFLLSAERNVYHRDLKTENILLNLTTGEIKLIDYGISAITEDVVVNTHNFGRHIHGCNPPEWGDGECVKPSKVMDWTLGRQLYTLLTNDQTLENDYVTYSTPWWPKYVSSGARRLAMKCLDIDPTRRPTFQALLYDPWLRTVPSVPCSLQSLLEPEKFFHVFQRLELDSGSYVSCIGENECCQGVYEEEEECRGTDAGFSEYLDTEGEKFST